MDKPELQQAELYMLVMSLVLLFLYGNLCPIFVDRTTTATCFCFYTFFSS
jgi:hypothetical protein